MTETLKVDGDTFTISVVNGRILVTKNDTQEIIEAQAAEIERLRDFVIYAAETSEDEHISRKAFNVLGDANDPAPIPAR